MASFPVHFPLNPSIEAHGAIQIAKSLGSRFIFVPWDWKWPTLDWKYG